MIFAFVGSAGNAILFVVSLLLWVVLMAYTLALMAHCYLVALQGTVAGVDEVKWPDETMADWLPQALGLAGVVALWLVPVGFLSRALAQTWLPGHDVLRVILLGGPVLWFFLPIGILSSLGSSSRWQVINGKVLLGLLKMTPTMILFYVITGLLGVAVGGLLYLGLFSPAWYALPVGMGLSGAALLIHARLVGRLGWLLQQMRAPAPPKSKPKVKKKPARKRRTVAVNDPWAEREGEEEPEIPVREAGYRAVEVEEKKAPRPAWMDPEPDPYTLADVPEGEVPTPLPPQKLELDQAQVEREIALRTRKPPNPPPDYPMFSGVYHFPFYSTSMKAWVWLTCWGCATGGAWRMVVQLFPG